MTNGRSPDRPAGVAVLTSRSAIEYTVSEGVERRLLNGKPVAVGALERKGLSDTARLRKYRAAERREKAILARLERRRVRGELMPIAEYREALVERDT